jgi:regulator of protease activity HflC (stomatin/prohibitin superfamily)
VALIVLWSFWPLQSVPTGHRGVITQFGEIKGIEGEGLHFIPPWQKLSVFSVRSETSPVDNAEGSTSDQQPVRVSLTVRYSIMPDKVAMVYEQYSHDGDLSSYVQTATQEVFKAVTARYAAPELIAKRQQVSTDISLGLKQKLAQYGAQVLNIDMRNFSFSGSYMAAINEKVTQEQLRQAAENKVKTVEAQQKEKIAVAEAEATAARARADGQAYAIKVESQAKADALRVQNAALHENKDVLELRRIEVDMAKAQKWDGKLPENLYAGAPIPFVGVK